jgi:hypothetical protein
MYQLGFTYLIIVQAVTSSVLDNSGSQLDSAFPKTNVTSVVQLDLVFPKPNSTYKPVYPFPLVFSFTNLSSAWAYPRTFFWDLNAWDDNSNNSILVDGASEMDISSTSPNSLPDHYLKIIPIDRIRNLTKYRVSLSIGFIIGGCRIGPNATYNPEAISTTISPFINFLIDPDGEVPDILAGGNCAYPLGAIGLEDPIPPNMYRDTNCPIPEKPAAKPSSCASIIDSTVASEVTQAMLNASLCNITGMSWPNTSLVNNCRLRSGARSFVPGMVYAIWPILGIMLLFSI